MRHSQSRRCSGCLFRLFKLFRIPGATRHRRVMTRRARPDDGFLFRFTRWQPLAAGPLGGYKQLRVTCAGCGTQATATVVELAGADWHRSEREYLCGVCSEREMSGRVDVATLGNKSTGHVNTGHPATALVISAASVAPVQEPSHD